MLAVADVRGMVDFGIVTIRPDEYTAVLRHLPGHQVVNATRYYEFVEFEVTTGARYGVAVARCLEQGNGDSFAVASDMIDDLDPCWLLVVGIAGGYPDDDYSLGDVLLASRIYDMTVSAEVMDGEEHKRLWNPTGGPVHHEVEKVLAAIPGWKARFTGWNTKKRLEMAKPSLHVPRGPTDPRLYGPDNYRESVRKSLLRHFGSNGKVRTPVYAIASVASGNTLVKDPDLTAEWKRCARTVRFVEMESAGVYRAARRGGRNIPVLVVRGLSDIVGFKRDGGWTEFACRTAASFAVAVIAAGVCNTTRPPVAPATPPSANRQPAAGKESLEAGMARLTFAELEVVTKHLARQRAEAGVTFKLLDPDEKMAKNGLTESTRELLLLGLSKVRLVEAYVETVAKIDPYFPDGLTGGFLDEYRRLVRDGLKGDELFQRLAQSACKVEPGEQYRAAGLAVLTYLFEKCDVFEK